jgi:hypothetical protein
MCDQSFEEDFKGFHQTFKEYTQVAGREDPFAREAFRGASGHFGLLSFQSPGGDRQDVERGRLRRWSAWPSVLPLDMQLDLIQIKASHREIMEINYGLIKWGSSVKW